MGRARRRHGPRRGRGWLIALACLAVLGLVGYFGLPMLLAPRAQIQIDQSPSAVRDREQQVTEFQEKLDTARQSLSQDPKAAVQVQVSNAEANAYLQKTVGKMPKEGTVYATGAAVQFKSEAVVGDVSLMVAGKPVGVHLDLKPEVKNDSIVLTVIDAAVGGIPLPSSLGPLGGVIKDSLPSGVTFDPTLKGFVIDPKKLPFNLQKLQLEAGKLTATVGKDGP
ncbi:MAG: ATP synthase subunit B family protein [Bacillota bacterium]